MKISSLAFSESGTIPTRHTCDGADISPALAWTGAPDGTRSFALIVDDPDAPVGDWVHWILFNIPARSTGIREGAQTSDTVLAGTVSGRNSWNRSGYGGPCPPSGTHRYFFKLFALDTPLRLTERATKVELIAAMKGHVLAEAVTMGTYARRTLPRH